jgi:cell division protein FtsL
MKGEGMLLLMMMMMLMVMMMMVMMVMMMMKVTMKDYGKYRYQILDQTMLAE